MRYLILAVFMFFAGCSSMVKMNYSSAIMQNYSFLANSPTIITHANGDLLAASYVPFIMEMLNARGFNSVYRQGDIKDRDARNIIYISLVQATKTNPVSSISFIPMKVMDTTSCFNYDGVYYCKDSTYPIITDYTTSFQRSSSYHFIMDWYDTRMKKRVLYVDGSIDAEGCIYEGIYKDLIYQTIARIDFNRPEVYSYFTNLNYFSLNCMLKTTKTLNVNK